MICPVVVVVNTRKPFTHASPRYGELRRGSCKRLFYFLHGIPQGGIANGLHGLNPRNTAHSTPLCKMRPALVWRLVMTQVHGGTRLVDKVNKLVIRTWDSLIIRLVWSGQDTSVSTLGRTIVKSKAKERA